MIKEDYVTFEQAKLLKEKGFPQVFINRYDLFYDKDGFLDRDLNSPFIPKDCYGRYTLSLVAKWLREEKGVYINIIADTDYPDWTDNWEYSYDVTYNLEGKTTSWCYDKFKTYEEALSAGIDKALELI